MENKIEKKKSLNRCDVVEGGVYVLDNRWVIWVKEIKWVEGVLNIFGPGMWLQERLSWRANDMVVAFSEKQYRIEEADMRIRDFLRTILESANEIDKLINEQVKPMKK